MAKFLTSSNNNYIIFLIWATLFYFYFDCTVIGQEQQGENPIFEGIRECPPGSDELLNECIKEIIEENRPFISKGLPQIGLQPLDPLRIKEIPIKFGNGTFSFNYKLINVQIVGFSNYSKGDVKVNTKKKFLAFDYQYPHLTITADYARGGYFLFFPLEGGGKVRIDLINFRSYGAFLLKVVQRNGKPLLKIDDIKIKSTVDDIKSDIPNLYHGSFLGTLVNEFMSSNAKFIYDEYVKEAMAKHTVEYMIKHSTIPTIFPVEYFINRD